MEAHESARSTFVWIAMRRALQEPCIAHENVTGFPQQWLEDLLGDIYNVDPSTTLQEMSSKALGWADRRVRHIRCLTHKTKVVEVLVPWATIAPMFSRVCKYTWRDYFFVGHDDPHLLEELEWARGRKSVGNPKTGFLLPRELTQFELALREFEFEQYKSYIARSPGCCCMVGQNATVHPQTSSQDTLCTVIRNPHLIVSPEHGRWMSARELLCTQGFPVYPVLLQAATSSDRPVCSFNKERAAHHGPRHRTSITRQAGDSMNVNMIGVALVQLFGFTMRYDMMLRT